MSELLFHGIIRNGRVEVDEPVNLPEGSQVSIMPWAASNGDHPPTASEIAATLAAMQKVQPLDMTDEERAAAAAWEKTVNDYTIKNLDRGLEDVFR